MVNKLTSFLLGILVVAGFTLWYTNRPTQASPDMFDLINTVREKSGMHILLRNRMLDESARERACDMVVWNYVGHTDSQGNDPWPVMERHGYIPKTAGENIIKSAALTDEERMKKFMNSASHSANILNGQFTEVGIGRCGDIVVQHFGRR